MTRYWNQIVGDCCLYALRNGAEIEVMTKVTSLWVPTGLKACLLVVHWSTVFGLLQALRARRLKWCGGGNRWSRWLAKG